MFGLEDAPLLAQILQFGREVGVLLLGIGCVILALSLTRVIRSSSSSPFGESLLARAQRRASDETYIIDNGHVISATHGDRGEVGFAALLARFGQALAVPLRRMIREGTPFVATIADSNGVLHLLRGAPMGPTPVLWITSCETSAGGMMPQTGPSTKDAEGMEIALRAAPLRTWSEDGEGRLLWSNIEAPSTDPELAALRAALPEDGKGRVRIEGGGTAAWFDLTSTWLGDARMVFAQPADAVVEAEAALGRFLETLTETFAHLPIGLAIFDRTRELGVFNPALSDLLSLDPVWLANRPSLRDVLDRLRDTRQIPDQRDFASWRERLMTLEKDAESGAYDEAWLLPSGRTLRVSGRPHPQGAVAFLFEDITPTVTLEETYREALDLRQTALDRIPDPLIMFDSSGTAILVNEAYRARLPVPEAPLKVQDFVHLWQERLGWTLIFSKLETFVTSGEANRQPFVDVLGSDAEVFVAPLPGGGTLVTLTGDLNPNRSIATARA